MWAECVSAHTGKVYANFGYPSACITSFLPGPSVSWIWRDHVATMCWCGKSHGAMQHVACWCSLREYVDKQIVHKESQKQSKKNLFKKDETEKQWVVDSAQIYCMLLFICGSVCHVYVMRQPDFSSWIFQCCGGDFCNIWDMTWHWTEEASDIPSDSIWFKIASCWWFQRVKLLS